LTIFAASRRASSLLSDVRDDFAKLKKIHSGKRDFSKLKKFIYDVRYYKETQAGNLRNVQ
jgi:hypothetical protein